jgi:PAS domain S-box-containing protein
MKNAISEPTTRPLRINGLPLTAYAFLYIGLYVAWLLYGEPQPQERILVGSLSTIFSGMLTVWFAFQARRSVTLSTPSTPKGRSELRSAWTWIGIGLTIWLAGDSLRGLLNLLFQNGQFHTFLLDLIYAVGSFALLVGILRYPRHVEPPISNLRLMIDIAITGTAVVSLAWLIVIRPIMNAIASAHAFQTAILYPSGDLILLLTLLILFQYNRPSAFPIPLVWITLGLAIYATSDLAYAYLLIQNGYQPASPVDLGWTIGDGLMILACISQLRHRQRAATQIRRRFAEQTAQRLQSLLPLVTTIILGWYTILDWQLKGQLDPLGLWGTIVLGLGLIARQGILAGEYEFRQYARLVNSIAEPIFICNRGGELRLINPALLDIAGYDAPEKLLGVPLQQIIRPSQNVQRILELGFNNGWSGEVNLCRKDGLYVPIMLSLRPVTWTGSERAALAGSAHDLSAIHRQEAALRLAYEDIAAAHGELGKMNLLLEQRVAEKTASLIEAYEQLEHQNLALQNLDRLKSDFVSLVSHELRAPLTNINAGIELILFRTASLPKHARQTLALVQSEILRLTRFIETILDLSALEAGRAPIYPAPLALSGVVRTIQRQLTHLSGSERVIWQIPETYPELLADERALISILFHLLDNALKYAPQSEVVVTAGAQGLQGWICVSDSGEGIPEEDMPFLFTRFFRSHSSDSQTIYGHGLGLYIVQRLLEAMNGKIEAANRPEGGASFTCWLPLVVEDAASEENESENLGG